LTIGLGLINFDLLIDSTLGTLVSAGAPRAIDAAFRIYMLPQGMFSVAIATVLFPALSRFAARRDYDGLRALTANGMRQIFMLLIPAAAATLALSTPITRLIYQHGAFGPSSTDQVSTAPAVAGRTYGAWHGLEAVLGRRIIAQVISVCGGLAAGTVVYAALVHLMGIPEARQVEQLVVRRLIRRDKRR